MEKLKTFRHEYKYHLKREEMYLLSNKLSQVMKVDRNKEGYLVRSLYFDSINDIDYYEKLDGDYARKKIRIRIYEDNPSYAKLEIKRKYDNHQLKESLIINGRAVRELINGNYSILLEANDPLATEIYEIMTLNCYRPKVIIEYNRMAFLDNTSTRITIDFDIKKSNDFDRFLTGDINYYDLVNKNEALLEVKFDRYLETHLSKVLKDFTSNNESFSKYIVGRNVK